MNALFTFSCLLLLVRASMFNEKLYWEDCISNTVSHNLDFIENKVFCAIGKSHFPNAKSDDFLCDGVYTDLIDKQVFPKPGNWSMPRYVWGLKDVIKGSIKKHHPQMDTSALDRVDTSAQLKGVCEELFSRILNIPDFSLGMSTKEAMFRLFYLYIYFWHKHPEQPVDNLDLAYAEQVIMFNTNVVRPKRKNAPKVMSITSESNSFDKRARITIKNSNNLPVTSITAINNTNSTISKDHESNDGQELEDADHSSDNHDLSRPSKKPRISSNIVRPEQIIAKKASTSEQTESIFSTDSLYLSTNNEERLNTATNKITRKRNIEVVNSADKNERRYTPPNFRFTNSSTNSHAFDTNNNSTHSRDTHVFTNNYSIDSIICPQLSVSHHSTYRGEGICQGHQSPLPGPLPSNQNHSFGIAPQTSIPASSQLSALYHHNHQVPPIAPPSIWSTQPATPFIRHDQHEHHHHNQPRPPPPIVIPTPVRISQYLDQLHQMSSQHDCSN